MMGHNYNLRSSKKWEPEVRSPSPAVGVDDNGDVMESEPQKRALHNEYILKELFSYLAVEDLKECRLVNQVWSQVATRVLAPKAPVIEFSYRDGVPRMEKFMDTFKNTENQPYRKFRIYGSLPDNVSPEKRLVLPKLVEKVAPTVTYLGVHSQWLQLFPWTKPKKHTEYPKLKSLELNSPLKCNEDFMINVLQHSPNLDTIAILWSVDRKGVDRFIENVSWSKIRHLKLDVELEDDNFRKLVDLGKTIKLQSFETVARGIEGGTTFTKFLDGQSGSLEALKLHFEFWRPDLHSDFRQPLFPKLKTLEVNIIGFRRRTADEMCGLLYLSSFSQRFPALNSFTVTGIWWFELSSFLRSENSAQVETVKTLKFLLLHNYSLNNYTMEQEQADKQHVVRHLAQMFPRVRKLVVHADVVISKAIELEHAWQHLKDLTLLCGNSRNADSALIGHDSDSEEYRRIVRSGADEQEETGMEGNIFRFLQNLETLELDFTENTFNGYNRGNNFSDLSCRFVLLKLRNLKCLNLPGLSCNGNRQITKSMIEKMSAKFKVLYKERKSEDAE